MIFCVVENNHEENNPSALVRCTEKTSPWSEQWDLCFIGRFMVEHEFSSASLWFTLALCALCGISDMNKAMRLGGMLGPSARKSYVLLKRHIDVLWPKFKAA